MNQHDFLARLAQPASSRIVLLVLDGVGDLRTLEQPQTALEAAKTPYMDALARRSALGRIVPAGMGITPGSGPGHLSLFGYDPRTPEADIGRGVLEALGSGVEVRPGDVTARGNFATADSEGKLTDRRAGRISTDECKRLVRVLQAAIEESPVAGVEVELTAGEGHRFVLLLRGEGLSPEIEDTDPQRLGVPPLEPHARRPEAEATVDTLRRVLAVLQAAVEEEPRANRLLLRGFSVLPNLPQLGNVHQMRCGAFAGYPLYRGVASACGMQVVPCGKSFADTLAEMERHWDRFDFFFLHVKQTDAAGEDGNLAAKAAVIEEVDAQLPDLLALEPDVLAITGDHSTPAPMKAHSWHPVPLLLNSASCFIDGCTEFNEMTAIQGHLGTFPAQDLMALMLANAGRLKKFGA